jgi:hypothetical protein
MRKKSNGIDIANVICQVLIALVAGIGIWFAYRQERFNSQLIETNHEQVRVMHDQMELDEAAQLALDTGNISGLDSGVPQIALIFKNSGKTPSLNGRITVKIGGLGPAGSPEKEIAPIERAFKSISEQGFDIPIPTINASQSERSPITFPNEKLSQKDIRDISSGRMRLAVYGTLEYKDIFGALHKKRFCMATQPFEKGPQEIYKAAMNSAADSMPTDDGSAVRSALKGVAAAIARQMPQTPQAMAFCLAGND